MSGFLKKESGIRRTAAVTAVVTYLLVSCTIDLFHNEGCQHSAGTTNTTATIFCNDLCQACMFLAGSNCTEPEHGSALVIADSEIISQLLPNLTIVIRAECASSIILRAPPLIVTS